jgi:cobaltochelatase CobN
MRPVFVLLSTADTDLMAARASGVSWRVANPTRLDPAGVGPLLDGAALVVVRLLGGRRTWPDGLAEVLASGVPVVALGGEATPDAELTALSTVPAGVAHDAQRYLVEGGPGNVRELHRFLSDTVLLTGEGFESPAATPAYGVHGDYPRHPDRPTVGVVFYRAHALAGNTGFVDTLCAAIEAAGGNPLPVYAASLRTVDGGLSRLLGRCDALIVTLLAAGGTRPTDAVAGGDEEAWSVEALSTLDVPVVQGLCLTSSRADPDGRRDAGGHPRVRRSPDQRAVLVQGGRPGRRAGLRRRPGAGAAGGRHRPGVRAAAAHPERRQAGGPGALVVPDQALPGRQRGRAGHAGLRRGAAAGAARAGVPGR